MPQVGVGGELVGVEGELNLYSCESHGNQKYLAGGWATQVLQADALSYWEQRGARRRGGKELGKI